MSINRNLPPIAVVCLIVSHLFIGISGHAQAQAGADEIPEHAAARRYGGGRQCNPGYRESNGVCTAIEIPENGYATNSAYGAAWECSHGFKKSDGSCTPVRVPANAYLDPSSGDSWKCSRGHRLLDDSCVVVDVPTNGYLKESTFGRGWE